MATALFWSVGPPCLHLPPKPAVSASNPRHLQRPPQSALLAKAAATIDVLSGGRLEFGVGAGCQRKEHEAYGFGFPDVRVRVEMMAEALEVTLRLWTQQAPISR